MTTIPTRENLFLHVVGNYKEKFNNYPHIDDIDRLVDELYDILTILNNATNDLQNRQIQFEYFEVVPGTSSPGNITVPTGGSIVLGRFGNAGDAILS